MPYFPKLDLVPPVFGIPESQLIREYGIQMYTGVCSIPRFEGILGESPNFKLHRMLSDDGRPVSQNPMYFSRLAPPVQHVIDCFPDYDEYDYYKYGFNSQLQLPNTDDMVYVNVLVWRDYNKRFELLNPYTIKSRRRKTDKLIGMIGLPVHTNSIFDRNATDTYTHCGIDLAAAEVNDFHLFLRHRQMRCEAQAVYDHYRHHTYSYLLEWKHDDCGQYYNKLHETLMIGDSEEFTSTAFEAYLLMRAEYINNKRAWGPREIKEAEIDL